MTELYTTFQAADRLGLSPRQVLRLAVLSGIGRRVGAGQTRMVFTEIDLSRLRTWRLTHPPGRPLDEERQTTKRIPKPNKESK